MEVHLVHRSSNMVDRPLIDPLRLAVEVKSGLLSVLGGKTEQFEIYEVEELWKMVELEEQKVAWTIVGQFENNLASASAACRSCSPN